MHKQADNITGTSTKTSIENAETPKEAAILSLTRSKTR